MNKNTKSTSSKVATLASETLTNPNSSSIARKLAGSALSQANTGNQTGKAMETTASKVLQSNKYSEQTRELAASILSQSNKNR